jgi:hypothetical protein
MAGYSETRSRKSRSLAGKDAAGMAGGPCSWRFCPVRCRFAEAGPQRTEMRGKDGILLITPLPTYETGCSEKEPCLHDVV